MPLAPTSSANSTKMQTKLSAWTPLNNSLANRKVFEERRSLLAKWVSFVPPKQLSVSGCFLLGMAAFKMFDRWSDSQRKAVLQDFVQSCSTDQLRFLRLSVSRQLPLQAADFTCLLPRALCLYLFSFLDPRSLCRCAQVSWHWKSIAELDQLWMPKCLRLGWCISFSSTPLEQGVWKRHYIQTVQELRLSSMQTASSQQQFVVPDGSAISIRHEEPSEVVFTSEECPASTTQPLGSSSGKGLKKEKQAAALPPWRDSDRRPKDTLRFNYLDNLDPIEQTLRVQTKSRAPTCPSQPGDGKRRALSEMNYKLRKAKSLMFLSSNSRPHPSPSPPPLSPPLPPHPPPHHQMQTRPPWASHSQDHPFTTETAKSLLSLTQWNAGIRPRPVRTPVPRLSVEALRASQRSHRSAPSTPLFEVQPWTVPALKTQERK